MPSALDEANEPAGQPVIDDPVGDQLAVRLEINSCSTPGPGRWSREVAISRRVRDKSRSSKRGRIARINPDTPGENHQMRMPNRRQQRCEQRDPNNWFIGKVCWQLTVKLD